MLHKCIKGEKIGFTLIRDDEGKLIHIIRNAGYVNWLKGYWLLEKTMSGLKIVKFLKSDDQLKILSIEKW